MAFDKARPIAAKFVRFMKIIISLTLGRGTERNARPVEPQIEKEVTAALVTHEALSALRGFYVVPESSSSMIVPCWIFGNLSIKDYLVLERMNEISRNWEQVGLI